VCKPNWADLPTAPIKSNNAIACTALTSNTECKVGKCVFNTYGTNGKTTEKETDWKTKKIANIPIVKKKSLTRLTIKALSAN
jgi:hypothetical protein